MPDQPSANTEKPVTDVQLASRVARVVELESILLREVSVRSELDPLRPPSGLEPQQQVGSAYERTDTGIVVHAAFDLVLSEGDQGAVPILSVTASYDAVYRVEGEHVFEPRELEYFARLNGTVNLWPYWRELVHTVAARTGLGSITLPVFRVKATAVEPAPK